ncbi:HAD family hydrolase [Natronocalculus amylovorans]|uniref:HAD-IA family hydrolase n=1 Tax=Natronocalculus amylovorans TaxID=2917812 RepID=A0AAE3K8Z8_9EURY|nr:HAD-IA family hydrolase [Natronocalculus amylovorans]MCL9817842.1 HAD-IA family hydrolase [Natronocalculus amylovorans]NUE03223.1 HAD family hydrolase [Halorubraceae archaeon YAN]
MEYDGYDAIVYDLDGTLVYLKVDWAAVARDVIAVYAAEDIDVAGEDLWTLTAQASSVGLGGAVEDAISAHEREGARTSDRLALADDVSSLSVPVGVCSLNCEAACEIALETHTLHSDVDAIVGRDTVPKQKPDPEPLLAAIDGLGATPEETLFIGDSESDKTTAERAGTDFRYVP